MTDAAARDPARWARVEALFDEALALADAERAAFLTETCAGDDGLRRTVERLLVADGAGPGLLDTPITGPAAAVLAGAARDLPPPALIEDERVGPYRVKGVLGRGGMGVVYRAERADGAYEQEVALKVVGGPVAGALAERFLRERQILARLAHPGIARLLDGGMTRDGRPWLAMERVQGEPLSAWVGRVRPDVDARLGLFLAVCDAVQYAHRSLVVHRDLKPSNILVEADGRPRLLDFGIARLMDQESDAARPDLTRAGMLVLTPEYAAPEQLRGEPATTAVDVYALGAILYELLAGRRPFEGRGGTLEDVLRLAREDPPPPSRAVRNPRLRRRLEGDLDTIVARALHREAARRYPSVEALAEDVRRHLGGLPVTARPDTLGYRAGRYVLRHRLGLGAAAAVLLALVGGLTTTMWQARAARLEAARARAVGDFLFSLFEAADPEANRGVVPDARELLDRGAARVDSLGPDAGPEVRVDMLTTLGLLYQKLGAYPQSDSLLTRAAEEARAHLGRDDRTAAALTALGVLAVDEGRLDADSLLREGLEMRRELGAPDTLLAESLGALGTLEGTRGHLDTALALHRRALALDRGAQGTASPRVATDLNNVGLALDGLGRIDEAEAALRDALRIRRELYGETHPLVAMSLTNLAAPLGGRGDLAEAEALNRKALEIRRRTLGEEHPDVARSLDQLALYVDRQGRWAEADSLYREALAMRRRLLGDEHPDVAATMNNLATVRYRRGDWAGAVAMQAEVVDIWRRTLGTDHPNFATALNNLGVMRFRAGALEEGERDLVEALALRRRLRGEVHEDVGASLRNLGDVRRAQGRLAEADSLYRASLDALRRALTPGHWRIADAAVSLGGVLVEEGRPAEALDPLREGLEIRAGSFVATDPRVAEADLWLGLALAATGSAAEAREHLEAAHAVFLQARGPDDPDTRRAEVALADLAAEGA